MNFRILLAFVSWWLLTSEVVYSQTIDSNTSKQNQGKDTLSLTDSATVPAEPLSGQVDGDQFDKNDAGKLNTKAVITTIKTKDANYVSSSDSRAQNLVVTEVPTPKKYNPKFKYVGLKNINESGETHDGSQVRALQDTFLAGGTVTNINNTGGSLFIPADPHGAAGPNHVVNVINVSIEFYQKDGTLDFSDDLQAFFSALSPANFTFDPKVVYDHFEDRWVVVTLERVDSGTGAASDTSLVLVAVSDDSNPNGNWTVTEINTKLDINGEPHWLDYPGLGVDDEAVYITGNMFRFQDGSSTSGFYGGKRLIILDKGLTGGFYDGGAANASIFETGGFDIGQMPAQIYGDPGGPIGTWLVGYSGLSNGNEAAQLMRVDNPLSASPTFTQNVVFFGDVDETGPAIPDAPQSGGATAIDSGDRRVLDAVWRNNALYFTTEVRPATGADAGEATAFWGEISTVGTPSFTQGGTIGGDDDIGADTYTSYASIAVNADDGITVGFTASSSSMFPSSYYVNRSPTDPLNTMRPATLIQAGQASYVRTFGGGNNRWGDYSATAVDPDEACFWVYNKHATTQGNATTGGENGRYLSAYAHICNDSPIAVNDSASVSQGGTVSTVNGTVSSLLANDTDVDTPDDTLSLETTAVSGPSNGTVNLNSNGTFSYTHDNSTMATDSFTYRVCDDGSPVKCADGVVNISITGINSPPTAGDDAIAVNEGETTTTLVGGSNNVLNNDSDPDDTNLTVNINDDVDNGALSLNSNGTFSYTHDGGETTTDAFIYQVCDDNSPTPACDTATVSITITAVNDAPVAVNDAISLDEGATASTLVGGSDSVLNNDSDADDLNLTATVNNDVDNGALNLNSDGTFSYTHDGSETSTDSFTYDVCDDETPTAACDTATVNITITAVNNTPVAGNDSMALLEGGSSTTLVGGSNTVLNNDSDADDTNLSVSVNDNVDNGSLILNSNGTFNYTHNGGETTSDVFTYEVCDDETPTPACDIATVSISITAVNDAPVATDDAIQLDEGATATTLVGGSNHVLNNDTDADDTNLSVGVNDDVDNGSLTLNSNGTFSYTHNGGETTSDSFTYDVCDDETPTPACNTATVSISITAINDEPNAVNDSITLDEGDTSSTLVGGSNNVLNNDTDADDVNLTVTLTADVNNGALTLNSNGTFSYQHNGGETTSDDFTYQVCDDEAPSPACDTAVVNITINPINDTPVAEDDAIFMEFGETTTVLDGGSSTVLNNDSDPDDTTLTVNLLSDVINGDLTLNSDGTFSYTHNGGAETSDQFTYEACDDESPTNACDTGTVNITVGPNPDIIFEDGFE